MQDMESIETTENTVDNTATQMIDMTEMDMEADAERATERILLMPTETIEAPIEAPTPPLNKEGDN